MIYVVDSMMGTGKSTAGIRMINESERDKRFIYVTPYLEEVERIKVECYKKNFFEPQEFGTKLRGLKVLLEDRENIVTTHALFMLMDKETLKLIKEQSYTLVLDEAMSVIDTSDISESDKKIIEPFTAYDADKYILKWTEDRYSGLLDPIKNACKAGCLTSYKNLLIQMLPIKMFSVFEDIYILTYMFKGQLQYYYFQLFNMSYKPLYVTGSYERGYKFTDVEQPQPCIGKINILEDIELNDIGKGRTDLSHMWYIRNSAELDRMRKNLLVFFRKRVNTPSSLNLWTTFKGYDDILKAKGYARGFAPQNIRATNDYRERTSVAYTVNRFVNPVVRNFFADKGILVDDDAFSTSEMIQFIYRSAIRDGKEITVYVPSRRMRTLLERWLEQQKA